MTAKTKKNLTNTFGIIAMAAALLIVALTILCVSLQATPADLYARMMNRPIDTPIIQIQSVSDIEAAEAESGLA